MFYSPIKVGGHNFKMSAPLFLVIFTEVLQLLVIRGQGKTTSPLAIKLLPWSHMVTAFSKE